MELPLREIAHARSGDKGNIANVAVFPYEESDYAVLDDQLTSELVHSELGHIVEGPVTRYPVPGVNGFNFVIEGALSGGATTTLQIDRMGKTLSSAVLAIEIEVGDGYVPRSERED
jgi:hypothetical protein